MAASRGRGARTKGAAAERELFKLLNERLGYEAFKRNLIQSRAGGADTEEHHPVAIEVKRQETLRLSQWLEQARTQATDDQTPVLAYRRNGDPWRILVDMDVDEFVAYLIAAQKYDCVL